jgi:hypothetical protein
MEPPGIRILSAIEFISCKSLGLGILYKGIKREMVIGNMWIKWGRIKQSTHKKEEKEKNCCRYFLKHEDIWQHKNLRIYLKSKVAKKVVVETQTFSNWIGFIWNPGGRFLAYSSNLARRSSITEASSTEALERLVALSSVTIFTPFFGSNWGTATLLITEASLVVFFAQSGIAIPNDSALRIEADIMKQMWDESVAENCRCRGKRFGADQKGAPVLVATSSGNVNVSCFTRFEK